MLTGTTNFGLFNSLEISVTEVHYRKLFQEVPIAERFLH